jgi:hypothetical protein
MVGDSLPAKAAAQAAQLIQYKSKVAELEVILGQLRAEPGAQVRELVHSNFKVATALFLIWFLNKHAEVLL